MEVVERKIHVGITGGIGTGKSTVCRIFEILGYPIFYADSEAKKVMVYDLNLVSAIKSHFGNQAYFENGEPNRKWLASLVFNDKKKLDLLNSLVHPATLVAYDKWKDRQQTAITFKEAALLFETGSYKQSDCNILIVAPRELRINRVIARDRITVQQVVDRMNMQMNDADKKILADFIVQNDEIEALIPQVLKIEQALKSRLESLSES